LTNRREDKREIDRERRGVLGAVGNSDSVALWSVVWWSG